MSRISKFRSGADQFSSGRRGADIPRGGGVLTRLCSSFATVIGYDLVISHTKL